VSQGHRQGVTERVSQAGCHRVSQGGCHRATGRVSQGVTGCHRATGRVSQAGCYRMSQGHKQQGPLSRGRAGRV
jgi:hypothetical protein